MGKTEHPQKKLDARGLRLAILVARYNPKVCEGLLRGALRELAGLGLPEHEVAVWRVPGAFELPLLARGLALKGKVDALVCLGAVIRGETGHYDFVCQGVTDGLMQAMLHTGVPMGFGILTTENENQAIARSGEDEHNKGAEAARTAVEMARLLGKI